MHTLNYPHQIFCISISLRGIQSNNNVLCYQAVLMVSLDYKELIGIKALLRREVKF